MGVCVWVCVCMGVCVGVRMCVIVGQMSRGLQTGTTSPTSSCLLSLPIKALGVPVQQSIILSDRGLGLSLKEHVGSLVRHGHDILLIKTSLSLSDWPVPVLFTPNILFLRQTHTHTHTHPHTHTHTHTRAHPLNNYLTLPWV